MPRLGAGLKTEARAEDFWQSRRRCSMAVKANYLIEGRRQAVVSMSTSSSLTRTKCYIEKMSSFPPCYLQRACSISYVMYVCLRFLSLGLLFESSKEQFPLPEYFSTGSVQKYNASHIGNLNFSGSQKKTKRNRRI